MRRLSIVARAGLLASFVLAAPTLLACLDHPLKPVEYELTSETVDTIQLTVNKDVDILFVIDNSGSMGEEQARVAENFPAFISVLEEKGVEANYRIGVTTTDNGNPWCGTTTPEAGKLQMSSCRARTGEFVFNGNPPKDATAEACTDLCKFDEITTLPTSTDEDPDEKPRPWLESIEGKTNLAEVDGVTPTTTEAFQCFGPQGIAGCGFESHLESMYKALLRAQKEDEAQYGFLRDDAILALVILSDEVDASYNNAYQSIWLPESMGGNTVFWSDPTASQPTSAVQWRAGVECTGGPGTYDECHAQNYDVDGNPDVSDSKAVFHPVDRYTEFVQELEDMKQAITPDQEVLVAEIVGVPAGYDRGMADIVYADATDPAEQLDFGIGAGCTNASTTPPSTARPPVREREFAEAFQVGTEDSDRNLYSICEDDFSPALEAIADRIRSQLKPACMPSCVADSDPIANGVQPTCTLQQATPKDGGGGAITSNIQPCNADESLPGDEDVCYVTLVGDDLSDECEMAGWNLEFRLVRREGVPAAGGTTVSATCQLSQNKPIDCPGLP
ncbi:MAG TPA: VWA domain-containing protein [Nannocystaceae bacterium]|nr:VWA domain-containing protein [Nannocystaceae bacterium]